MNRWGASMLVVLAVTARVRAEEPSTAAAPSPALAADVATGVAPPPAPPAEPGTTCHAARFVVFDPSPTLDATLTREIEKDLVAELAPRGISVCPPGSSSDTPAAIIGLREQDAVLAIEVDDRTTYKRVGRDIRLKPIPESGRALAIAIAIDELLRASWAELTLARTPEPPQVETPEAQEPPPAKAPRPRTARQRERNAALSLDLGYTHGPTSWNAFALNLRASLWPWPWIWVEAGVGVLRALTVDVPIGEVSAQGVSSGLLLGACLPNSGRAKGCAGVRAGLDWITFSPTGRNGASAHQDEGLALRVEGVSMLALSLSQRLFALAQIALGGPLQALVATDGSDRLMGVQGLLFTGTLGLGVEL